MTANTLLSDTEIDNLLIAREKKFDENVSQLAYYCELQKTQKLIKEFTDKLLEQLAILVTGGNRILSEVVDKDELIDYLIERKFQSSSEDNIAFELYQIYEDTMSTYTGFCHILEKNKIFYVEQKQELIKKFLQ